MQSGVCDARFFVLPVRTYDIIVNDNRHKNGQSCKLCGEQTEKQGGDVFRYAFPSAIVSITASGVGLRLAENKKKGRQAYR